MRFAVPQFIDVEDKIFGPLTFRQFIYLAGGGGLAFIVYKVAPLAIGLPLGAGIAVFALALAFVKINDKPFINIIEAAFNYFINDKRYIWKKEQGKKKGTAPVAQVRQAAGLPHITGSKLHDIAWGLDVLDRR